MKNIFVSIFFIIILGCTSNNVEFNISLEKFIITEIDDLILNNELFKAFQLLTYYENQNISSDEYLKTKNSLYEKFPEQLKHYYENNDWNNFFISYKNLNTLGFDLTSYDINNILYSYINDNINEKLFKYGVLLSEDNLDYTTLSNEKLNNLYNSFNKIANLSDFPKLINELRNRNINIVSQSPNKNYLDGVITIFVNKGIKINNGIGNRDIVIGSGFFIDKEGYAITNYHVIESTVDPKYEGIANLYVKLNGSIEKIPAKVIGWDSILDIALIKVSAKPEYCYSFSNNDNLQIGEKVIAVGSPGGLGSTVTSGIVSSNSRTFLEIGSVIQIDSPINPGNSGGPLIDDNHLVTNIVFAGIESFEGVNFAIPIKYLKTGLKTLYNGGHVEHVWIGAGVVLRKKKLEIVYIKPGSPAHYLGLNKSDIILGINGKSFESIVELQDFLTNFSPLEIITLDYESNGEKFSKKICLEKRPDNTMDSIVRGDSSDHLYIPLFGMDIKYTGKILWNKEYLINDVLPGTIADELELLPGDIIVVKKWDYNDVNEAVILELEIQSKKEGYWKKNIQIAAPINSNFFI